MSKYTTIQVVISLGPVLGWKLHDVNVNTSFLNREFEEEVYIDHLEGFVIHGNDSNVYNLNKSSYWIKQDP